MDIQIVADGKVVFGAALDTAVGPAELWESLKSTTFGRVNGADRTAAALEGQLTLRVSSPEQTRRLDCDSLTLVPVADGWKLHPADLHRLARAWDLASRLEADGAGWQLPSELPPRRLVIAHRGACGYVPEHTLQSACLAYGLAADYVEQDVVLTKDGVPIVLHDIHLDTVTDVAKRFPDRARADRRYYALDFTWEEIQSLSVHERVDVRTAKAVFPNRFPLHQSQFRLASLSQMIELVQGLNHSSRHHIGIYPELKHPAWHRQQGYDLTAVTLEMLHRYGYRDRRDRIYVQCFEAAELERIRAEFHCQLMLIQLIDDDEAGDQLWSEEGLRRVGAYADAVGPSLQRVLGRAPDGSPVLSPLVSAAHRSGLVVHPWTVREDQLPEGVANLKTLVDLCRRADVDGFFTDFPDRSRW